MTWLTPLYAGIAAAIAIPTLVILYFLKLRRRDVEISTTLLWRKAIQDLQANAPFQRLRRNILLILQLLALFGLLAALGQPQIKSQTLSGVRHVIMIDRSGSMLALDEEEKGKKITRLEAAKKQGLALVESMRDSGLIEKDSGDSAMVVAFDTQAEIRQQLTSDKAALRRAIESITPTEGPTSIEEAIRLALAQKPRRVVEDVGLEAGPPVTFHIYSDGRIPDAAKSTPGPEDSVEFHRIGLAESGNVAIVGMRAERSFENPNKLSIYVSLENNEPLPRSIDVELLIDGQGAGLKTTTVPAASGDGPALSAPEAAKAAAAENAAAIAVDVPAGGTTPQTSYRTPGVGGVVFSLERAGGAVVQVRLRSPGLPEPPSGDVLALDDAGWLVVPPAKRLAVAVVSNRGNLFLSTALQGLPLSRLTEIPPSRFEQMMRDGTHSQYDVIILDGWLPPGALAEPPAPGATLEGGAPPAEEAAPEDVLPPGRYLIIGSLPRRIGLAPSGIRTTAEPTGASIIDWRRDHPLLRSVNLDGLVVAKSPKITLDAGSPAVALANADIGPIVLDAATNDVRAVIVPFDIAESNWPFNVSFVVFMASAVGYLGDDAGTGASGRMVQPGSVLSDRLPQGAEDITVKPEGGESQRLQAAADGRIVFGPVPRAGVYEVSWKGPPGPTDVEEEGRSVRRFAANLFDSRESDLGAVDRVELASREVQARTQGSSIADKKLWPWLLLAALLVVMLEWFVYNRKVHV